MTDTFARLLFFFASAIGRLPWTWLRALGDGMARLWLRRGGRESRVAGRNLEMAYPELLPGQREALQGEILRTTARQALETLRLWTRPHAENLRMIRETQGEALFDAAIASGRGVIVAAPHYGNWELLNQWLASRTPLAILYRPPDSALGEAFLRRVRADAGDRVTQVRAEAAGIRQLFKRLRDGGVVGILPDQQPKSGDGEFAPFFGVPAYTMSLLPRLAERSGAIVLFAYCERVGDLAFALRIEPAPDDIASGDTMVATSAVNAAVERIARRDPAQYQWTYKRYTLRPSLNPYHNPYRDLKAATRRIATPTLTNDAPATPHPPTDIDMTEPFPEALDRAEPDQANAAHGASPGETSAPAPEVWVAPSGWQPLPPRAYRVFLYVALLVAVVPCAFASLMLRRTLAGQEWGWMAIAALWVVGIAFALWVARKRYRYTFWMLDEDGFAVRRGRLWQWETRVPTSRVQHLDLKRGPLERGHRLASLVLHTAGTRLSAVSISGLDDADAERLRDHFSRQIDRQDDDDHA